jgi:hypothetical protein
VNNKIRVDEFFKLEDRRKRTEAGFSPFRGVRGVITGNSDLLNAGVGYLVLAIGPGLLATPNAQYPHPLDH